MSKVKTIGLVCSFVCIAGAVLVSVYIVSNHYLTKQDTAKKPTYATCTKHGTTHTVLIENNVVVPQHTNGKLCDLLAITNKDNRIRLMAFGPHEHHVAYDGIKEKVVGPGQSLTVIMNATGTYYFHDHTDDIVKGNFTVAK